MWKDKFTVDITPDMSIISAPDKFRQESPDKMNTIEIKDLEIVEGYIPNSKRISYNVLIDGVVREGVFDLNTLFEDKHSNMVLSDNVNADYSQDEPEFRQHNRHYYNLNYAGKISWNYIDNCDCGIAGCAGVWNGVFIKRRKYNFEYRIGKDDGYPYGIFSTGKRFLSFSIQNIESVRKQLTDFAKSVDPELGVEEFLDKHQYTL